MTTRLQLKDGTPLIIREPGLADAEPLLKTARAVLEESPYLLFTPGEFKFTVEQEKEWILNHQKEANSVVYIAEVEEEMVGIINVRGHQRQKQQHVAELGMSVRKKWRRKGIGRAMLQRVVRWCEANPRLEKLTLCVFTANKGAIRLYEDFGFEVEGKQVKAFKQPDGTYLDDLLMYKWV